MKFRTVAPLLIESDEGHKVLKRGERFCCFSSTGHYLGDVGERDDIKILLSKPKIVDAQQNNV